MLNSDFVYVEFAGLFLNYNYITFVPRVGERVLNRFVLAKPEGKVAFEDLEEDVPQTLEETISHIHCTTLCQAQPWKTCNAVTISGEGRYIL